MSQAIKKAFSNILFFNFNKTIRYIPTRLISQPITHKKGSETPLHPKTDEVLKVRQRSSIKKLEELLNCRPFVAREIVLKYKKFLKVSNHNISENYYYCIKNGITKETLLDFPEVLAESDIPYKIEELKKLPYDINVTTPLLSLAYGKLKIFVTQEIAVRRITFVSKILEIQECKMAEYLIKRPFLLSLSLEQLENNVRLLTDFGITKREIIKDLWVLRYSTDLIKERLLLAKQNNIETFKTWMVRVQPEIFKTYIRRRSDTKSILGDNSLAEYLSERLECNEEVAKYLIAKQPALQNKSLKKMNEMIDFLFAQGFKPVHIRRIPKILLHSVETTKARLKELEAQGMELDALYVLTKSQRQYRQYYETLIKANKGKLKSC